MRRFELHDGTTSKFWSVAVRGKDLLVAFGRVGSRGQGKTKPFATPALAKAAAATLIAEKVRKGYSELAADPKAPAASSPASVRSKASPKREGARTTTPTRAPSDADRVRRAYGFDLPEDLFHFWEFAKSARPKRPLDALEALEIRLTGPFDLLAGRLDRVLTNGPLHPLLHFRFRHDPPEFLTVAMGDSDGLHWGYWFDERPTEACVCDYYARDAYELSHDGATLFDAFRAHLEGRWQGAREDGERAELRRLDRLRETLTAASGDTVAETGDRYLAATRRARHARLDRVISTTREGMGVVAPAASYRPLSKASPWLVAELEAGRVDPLVREAERALAGGLPGGALKLGRELWGFSDPAREAHAARLLHAAYTALGRAELAEIVRIHAAHRWLPTVDVTDYDEASLADARKSAGARARSGEKVDVVYRVEESGGKRTAKKVAVVPHRTPLDALARRTLAAIEAIPDASAAADVLGRELAAKPDWAAAGGARCQRLLEARRYAELAELATRLAKAAKPHEAHLYRAYALLADYGRGAPTTAALEALAEATLPRKAEKKGAAALADAREEVVALLRAHAPRLAAGLLSHYFPRAASLDDQRDFLMEKGMALHDAQDDAAAAACFRELVALDGAAPSAHHWLAHVTTGPESMAAYQAARRLFEEADDDEDAYYLGAVCAMLGDTKAALRHLTAALADDEEKREEARTDRELDSLRGMPRFERLLEG